MQAAIKALHIAVVHVVADALAKQAATVCPHFLNGLIRLRGCASQVDTAQADSALLLLLHLCDDVFQRCGNVSLPEASPVAAASVRILPVRDALVFDDFAEGLLNPRFIARIPFNLRVVP